MDFSVIIPTYNRYDMCSRAIDSVLAQTNTRYELIVVDDGSTDATPRIKDDYRDRVRYIRQENRGVSAARNTGIRASSADWILLLDSDDIWHPEKIAAHALYIDEHPLSTIHQCDDIWIRNGRRVNPAKKHMKHEGMIFADSLHLCLISPSAVAIKRGLFTRYGYFDEELPVCEDYDLWLRISLHERVGLVPRKLITRNAGHADQLSASRPAMDMYRLYAILKLLDRYSGSMTSGDRDEAARVARVKASILLKGALKRGRYERAAFLKDIIQNLEDGYCNSTGYRTLLQV